MSSFLLFQRSRGTMASENLPPQIISRVMAEIRELVKKPADGIEYFDPSENDDDDESRTNVPSSSSAGDTTCEASGSSNTAGQPSTRVISTYR